MPFDQVRVRYLLGGLLADTGREPVVLIARMCDLRPRFLAKGQIGRGYRAIARNGRILLASDVPLPQLDGVVVSVRVQTWHRTILPGDPAEPYGLLLSA